MKILINLLSDSTGNQLIDAWHAYKQHQTSEYANDKIHYTLADRLNFKFNKHDYNLSILFAYIHDININVIDQYTTGYDLVLLCNGGESLQVGSPTVKNLIENNNNVFIITNGYLSQDHVLFDKNIWFPHNIQTCRDIWTRHFYPQYFDLVKFKQLSPAQALIYINGENRSNRQFFIDSLFEVNPNIPVKNSLSTSIKELFDCQWESDLDTQFKNWVNSLYDVKIDNNNNNNYYSNSVHVGINDKFGSVPPGYFHLPLYFEYRCVIFPETSWQNNELCITEKAIKCFYSGCLPFPVSGANVNRMYNELGFYTAWNLLPSDLQKFDSELDHRQRYKQMVEAIHWLYINPEVFTTNQFEKFVESNRTNFLTCACDYISVQRFDQLLTKFIH